MRRPAWFLVLLALVTAPLVAQSVFTQRPDDPHAVYVERGAFGAVADGKADDTAALQAAIDRVQATTGAGIVFVAEGRYRITHTLQLWTGIRLIGYGAHRPVILLGPDTPGYQQGHGYLGTGRYMLQFDAGMPAPGKPVVDANEFTFYSGIENVDFQIGSGNPAAIAVRFHVAQHSFLEHMRFDVGQGRAALEDVGNGATDLQIDGGDYGIISVRTSPAWQFLLTDSTFTGQRRAAIHTQEVGMTLVRDRIAHTPIAVQTTPGMIEELYGRDLVLEDIGQTAIVLGEARKNHNEVTLDHVICRNVPQLVEGEPGASARFAVKGSAQPFIEQHLAIGEMIGPDGREQGIQVHHREQPGAGRATASDIPALPPMRAWVNVHTLDVKGDGSDDTAALQAAIDRHRVLYLPSGVYRVTGTLHLRPDTVLIGFNPATTEVLVTDDASAFAGDGDPVPVLESAHGGAAILSGFAIATSMKDHRATALVWRAGAHSLVDDVNLRAASGRGLGVLAPQLPSSAPARFDRAAYVAELGTQNSSLWVKEGGGGIFRGIWTSNSFARSGLLIENTTTPSVVYQLSCEHHMKHETQFYHAANWTVYALQTEEENPAGVDSFSIDLRDARNMLFANTFMYRVSRQVLPKLNAVEAAGSSGIRFENVHTFSMTRLAYDNSIFDSSADVRVRDRDFTAFTLDAAVKPEAPLPLPAGVFADGAKLELKSEGFSNADGLTVDEAGNLYFTDAAMHKVYRWNAQTNKAEALTEQIAMPMAAAYAGNGSLLVVDYERSVYSVDTATGAANKLAPADAPRSGTNLLLPVGLHQTVQTLEWQLEHRGYEYAPRSNMATVGIQENQPRSWFYAPGTANAIMAGGNWLPQLQASQWALFHVGQQHMAVSEDGDEIDRVTLDSLEHATAAEFAPRGGISVVTDSAGNVYVASGELYIYNSAGKQIGVVEIPQRPGSLAFGGADRKTLFIGARSSLFSLRTEAAGR